MTRAPAREAENGSLAIAEFATKRLHLAIYLHASGLLPYLRTEPNGDGTLRFVFADEQRLGPTHQLNFERGATVSARDLFSSQTFLRREMQGATEHRGIEESKNDRTHH